MSNRYRATGNPGRFLGNEVYRLGQSMAPASSNREMSTIEFFDIGSGVEKRCPRICHIEVVPEIVTLSIYSEGFTDHSFSDHHVYDTTVRATTPGPRPGVVALTVVS